MPRLYPRLNLLFAAASSSVSSRPVETLEPLAAQLGLPINQQFEDKHYAQLARCLLKDAGSAGSTGSAGSEVLVCWHHGKLPDLARCLGVSPPEDPWPAEDFGRIWQIDFASGAPPTILELREA
jgi:hypothetical protein